MTAAAPAPVGHADWTDSVYERLAGDEDGRVCKAISEDACRQTPGNFFRMLVANALGTLADAVASAKTTLPWPLLQLGAPGWMGALLVPIRKGVWVAGAAVQGFSLLALGAVALWLGGMPAGLAVLVLVTLFSLARGACSVAYKDVQGKTIPKSRRGRLAGWIGAVAGVLSLAMAALAWWPVGAALAAWLYPLAFLGLGVAHAGVRLGRKTYLVDMAEGDRRTDYVAVSNSVIGALLLAAGALSALAAVWSAPAVVLGLGLAGLAGAALSLRWRDVSG